MSTKQEFMNLEQVAGLILGGREISDLRVVGILVWALFYEYAKNPKSAQLTADFQSVQQGLQRAETIIEQPDLREMLDKVKLFATQIDQAAKNPYDEDSINFMARIKIVLQAYYAKRPNNEHEISRVNSANAEQYSMLMLSRLGLIQDELVKYNVSGYFLENPYGHLSESARHAFVMRANSVHATARDLNNMMVVQSNYGGDLHVTFQDLENIARRDLTAELSKESPNLDNIKEIIGLVNYGAEMTKDDTIIQQTKQVYDLQKLLLPNALEYISKMPDGYTQKITELEGQIAQLKQQVNEKTDEARRLGRELDETKQTLTDAQAQNQTLNRENTALRQENATLGHSKADSEEKLHRLIAAADNVKFGFGSRGADEFKRQLNKVTAPQTQATK